MAGKRDFGQIMPGWNKGTWRVRWREGGKIRQKTIGKSKALAARFLAKKQADLAEQEAMGHAPIEPMRFETLFERYVELLTGAKEPATLIREERHMRRKMLPFFTGMDMDKVRRADIERFLIRRTTEAKLSGSTRNKQINMLSSFFQKAVDLGHARENPCRGIKRQKEALKPVPFLTVEDQARLVATTEEPLKHLVALLLDTGLRLGEALRLERRDVDFARGVVTVRTSKNKTTREVPFTTRGRDALRVALAVTEEGDLPKVRDYAFPALLYHSVTGEVLLRPVRRTAWTKARKAAGFPDLRIHDCRHVWAVTCVRAGISLQELRELGGWKSLHMVLRYSRHVPENTPDLARSRLQAFLSSGGGRASNPRAAYPAR